MSEISLVASFDMMLSNKRITKVLISVARNVQSKHFMIDFFH